MAVMTSSRPTMASGSVKLSRRTQLRRANKPVALAIRHYWSSRHQSGSSSAPYKYLKSYPQRSLPRYDGHARALQYDYMNGTYAGRSQLRRSVSNWAPEDGSDDKSRRKSGSKTDGASEHNTRSHHGGDPWETRTRLAGERYLRLMEDHMKLLRKDPYWSLFGGSELRGVWNPWRKYYDMHSRTVRESLGTRPVKPDVDLPTERPSSTPSVSTTDKSVQERDVEYRFDPISGKRVPVHTADVAGSARSDHTIAIPVKTYKASVSRWSALATEPVVPTQNAQKEADKPELTGFAKQPWLVQEGFVPFTPKSQVLSTKTATSSGWDKMLEKQRRRQENRLRQAAAIAKEAGETADKAQKVPQAERLPTALDRIQSRSGLKYDDTPDKREDLDLLRPSDVRASSGKTVRQEPEPTLSREQRWLAIHSTVSDMFSDREARLNREFAADRWRVTRAWSAYPGDLPQTPEERAARRQALEKSFNSSLDKFEFDMMKLLGTVRGKYATGGSEMSIHSTDSMRGVAKYIQTLRDQINAKREQASNERKLKQRQEADAVLQKEVSAQKAAMSMHENRPRIARSYRGSDAASSAKTSGQTAADRLAKKDELVDEIRAFYKDSLNHLKATPTRKGEISPASIANKAMSTYPPKSHPELDSSAQLLEASVRDFEKIMEGVPSQRSEVASASVKPTNGDTVAPKKEVPVPQRTEPTSPAKPTVYLLLAYDAAKGKLCIKRSTSSKYEERSARRTVESILSRLDHPAKYFEHMERLEKAGYELVAGSRKIVIYKDTLGRDAGPSLGLDESNPPTRGWGTPVKPTTSHETSAKDTLDEIIQEEIESVEASARKAVMKASKLMPPRVRRMEERFSGPGPRFADAASWEKEQIEEHTRPKNRRSRLLWRIFFAVGLVYGFGVFMEWSKERDRERLTKEYQQEVQRVREIERRRAEDKQNKVSSWSF